MGRVVPPRFQSRRKLLLKREAKHKLARARAAWQKTHRPEDEFEVKAIVAHYPPVAPTEWLTVYSGAPAPEWAETFHFVEYDDKGSGPILTTALKQYCDQHGIVVQMPRDEWEERIDHEYAKFEIMAQLKQTL